ncbi:hypothetical protein JOB18_015910 [Solea senegalensis]|uniref:Uncharacterized protein n=1 Tax=Solea senegalensis TaxID=28829 RepID=A0AAV6SMW5_SOLSE|nr:hypothetical protein JOB18_015910 [Solea senegalensis]
MTFFAARVMTNHFHLHHIPVIDFAVCSGNSNNDLHNEPGVTDYFCFLRISQNELVLIAANIKYPTEATAVTPTATLASHCMEQVFEDEDDGWTRVNYRCSRRRDRRPSPWTAYPQCEQRAPHHQPNQRPAYRQPDTGTLPGLTQLQQQMAPQWRAVSPLQQSTIESILCQCCTVEDRSALFRVENLSAGGSTAAAAEARFPLIPVPCVCHCVCVCVCVSESGICARVSLTHTNTRRRFGNKRTPSTFPCNQ